MKIFVSAGEVSGDLVLARILARLRERIPDIDLCGFGGEASARWGLQPLLPLSETAFNGIGDVLRRGAFCLRLYRLAVRSLEEFRPDRVLLIDYPGLNLRVARRARELSLPVYYVAPPQVWAYRNPEKKLRRLAGALKGATVHTLFPFEAAAFSPFAGKVVSGHFFHAPSLSPPVESEPVARRGLCLCPGSRLSALRRNLPLWLRGLAAIGEAGPTTILTPPHLESEARKLAQGYDASVSTDKEKTLAAAGRAIAFPGTITLELALRRVPTLVLAALDPLTLWGGKAALRGSRLALPNLLLDDDVFPEWAGTASRLDARRFASLWEGLNRREWDWEALSARLAAVMGPAAGVEIAGKELG